MTENKKCKNILMIEDDILFAENWYTSLLEANASIPE
jgi:hypothetical protein